MAIILWCLAIFVTLNGSRNVDWDTVRWTGFRPDRAIYQGAPWALVTSAFVHIELLHFVFNMIWLWILGGAFERRFGSVRFGAFVLCAAFVSSGAELLLGHSGIGFSGVGYALFGFAWILRPKVPEFMAVVSSQTVMIFLGWGLLCVVGTYAGFMAPVANLAHAGGLAFGVGLGLAVGRASDRILGLVGVIALSVVSVLPIVYNPNSEDWVAIHAERLHRRGAYDEAIGWYERYLQIGSDTEWGLINLAGACYGKGDSSKLKETIDRLATLDPGKAEVLAVRYGIAERSFGSDEGEQP